MNQAPVSADEPFCLQNRKWLPPSMLSWQVPYLQEGQTVQARGLLDILLVSEVFAIDSCLIMLSIAITKIRSLVTT